MNRSVYIGRGHMYVPSEQERVLRIEVPMDGAVQVDLVSVESGGLTTNEEGRQFRRRFCPGCGCDLLQKQPHSQGCQHDSGP